MRPTDEESSEIAERRRNLRVPLHWTVLLAHGRAAQPSRSKTQDLSKGGFYCLLDEPLTPGERIECDIVVPTHAAERWGDALSLRCHVQVLRVDKVENGGGYGIACQIQDYFVVRTAGDECSRRVPPMVSI
jgi:hypothetical protein